MNRKKLNIIKRVLGAHKWVLRESSRNFPHIFVLDNNGNVIMGYSRKSKLLFYNDNDKLLYQKIQQLFGFYYHRKIKKLMEFLVEERFGWKGVIAVDWLNNEDQLIVKEYFQTK